MLNFVKGHKVCNPERLFEGYAIADDCCINANVNAEKISDIFEHFIVMHEEPLFFILELPVGLDREKPVSPGIIDNFHKDVYYIDGCTNEDCLALMMRYGELLINDGLVRFGFGGHESQDEIMLDKYNVIYIYSNRLSNFDGFFEAYDIQRKEKLVTAWNTFSSETPGESKRYELNGKTVYDLPNELKDWGIYLAETRTE